MNLLRNNIDYYFSEHVIALLDHFPTVVVLTPMLVRVNHHRL